MSRDNTNDPTPYAIYCYTTGCPRPNPESNLVFLDEDEYDTQLYHADSLWSCPYCDSEAVWDDDSQITNPNEEEWNGDEDEDPTDFGNEEEVEE